MKIDYTVEWGRVLNIKFRDTRKAQVNHMKRVFLIIGLIILFAGSAFAQNATIKQVVDGYVKNSNEQQAYFYLLKIAGSDNLSGEEYYQCYLSSEDAKGSLINKGMSSIFNMRSMGFGNPLLATNNFNFNMENINNLMLSLGTVGGNCLIKAVAKGNKDALQTAQMMAVMKGQTAPVSQNQPVGSGNSNGINNSASQNVKCGLCLGAG